MAILTRAPIILGRFLRSGGGAGQDERLALLDEQTLSLVTPPREAARRTRGRSRRRRPSRRHAGCLLGMHVELAEPGDDGARRQRGHVGGAGAHARVVRDHRPFRDRAASRP